MSKVMTDAEVGQAWESLKYSHNPLAEMCIRTLVEERAAWHYQKGFGHNFEDCKLEALRDFHIDPKTWGGDER